MNVVVVGLNHRTAAISMRERFSLPDEKIGEALCRLQAHPHIEENVILSTCNRVEIYAAVKETALGIASVRRFFLEMAPDLPENTLLGSLYIYTGGSGLQHLFRVASGLDSLVIGEPQILGQVKDAFEHALRHKTTGVILNRVFKKTLSVAKRVRTETRICEHAVSISYAAVQLAKKVFGQLNTCAVLLIGAGEMAELAARHFMSQSVQTLCIANRNYERAVALAQTLGGIPIPLEHMRDQMVESDIVLCSAGASHYLIDVSDVLQVIKMRGNRPIFFIDISVPRNIDPEIHTLDNVFLYDIDDLNLAIETHLRLRQAEALKAEVIISEEAERFSLWFKSLAAVPTITALRDHAESIRKAELEKVLGKMGMLTATQREAVEWLTTSIVNKLLHHPLTAIKEESTSPNGSMVIETARKLFHLDPASPVETHERSEGGAP